MSTVVYDIENGRIEYHTLLLKNNGNNDVGSVRKNTVSPRKIAFTSYMNKPKQDGKIVNNNNNNVKKHVTDSKTKRRKNNNAGQPLFRIINNRINKRKNTVGHLTTPALKKKKKPKTIEKGNCNTN